ncbi:DUF6455 family protein [Phaeovulum sp.]|uniref:DUF6455 family protein n=1 Tax=Phaeovulum sp. TaxID=2934796 RepID=UPI0039E3862B
MGVQGNVDLHFWITRGMARQMGVNLTEAIYDGLLTQADLAEMVARCRTCSGTQGCLAFLSGSPGAVGAAPDWCLHAGVLSELRLLT